jgi:tetratricopeptide (TPR) repeat protein
VTEQSEHLSNAQIENYGNRTSGAGPEAAQGDEHQRVNHQSTGDQSNDQSIDDQRVEAHLTDCPSCRNRVLDFHRSLFASPTFQPEPDRSKAGQPKYDALEHDSSLYGHLPSGYAPSGYAPSGHLPLGQKPSDQRPADSSLGGVKPTDSALADSNFANPKYPADPQVRMAPTPECPSDDALRQLAAGLTPDDVASKLTQHAATCHHCGPLLRTYTEIFSDDFSPEEQAALASLKSGSAAWQKNTARKMLKQPVPPSPSPPPIFSWKWIMVPALPAVALIAAGFWYFQRDTPEKVEKLLAQAQTEQRTTEMRWPGASWSQYSVQRGTKFEAKSTSLMQTEIAVGRQAEKTLQKLAWIRIVAEKEIIAGHPQNAIPALEQAVRSHPSSVPLLLDLAIAYFGQGEQTRSQESYEKSRDLLSSVLQREPTNTVALFNRALVYERLNAKGKAADDWKTFLKTEKDVRWLVEAQKKLADLSDLN